LSGRERVHGAELARLAVGVLIGTGLPGGVARLRRAGQLVFESSDRNFGEPVGSGKATGVGDDRSTGNSCARQR
jgi:hypothetical protein